MAVRTYRELIAWQKAMDLAEDAGPPLPPDSGTCKTDGMHSYWSRPRGSAY
jgi:hypothetical protein